MEGQGIQTAETGGTEGPFKAWHFWAIMGALFAVVFAVNAVFVVAALSSWTGVVEDDAYARGLAYNSQLAQVEDQKALGWTAGLEGSGPASDAQIALRLTDAGDMPLSGAQITVAVRRPTQATLDRTVVLTEGEAGLYGARLELPARGLWELRATIERDGETLDVWKRTVFQ